MSVPCPKCGQSNAAENRFCRYCGERIPEPAFQPADPMFPTRRPYAWQTDEFQTEQNKRSYAKGTLEHIPLNSAYQNQPGQFLAPSAPRDLTGNYRCPNCGTNYLPIVESRISTAGWITFSLLLVFTFIFFWVGLLMKENVSVCPVCKKRLN